MSSPNHLDSRSGILEGNPCDLHILDALAFGVRAGCFADIAHSELSAEPSPSGFYRRLAIGDHQAQLAGIEVQVSALALDDLVVTLIAADFEPSFCAKV